MIDDCTTLNNNKLSINFIRRQTFVQNLDSDGRHNTKHTTEAVRNSEEMGSLSCGHSWLKQTRVGDIG